MKILMVLSDNIYPPDMRVEKEASALVSVGNEVHLICRNDGNQKKKEMVGGMIVHRIDFPQHLFIIDHLLFFLAVFVKIMLVAKKETINAIHAHDLTLALPSLLAGKISGKTVIIDLHENYPAMVEYSGVKGSESGATKLIVHVLKWVELFVCQRADWIIIVIEEAKERLVGLGIRGEKIIVVSNYANVRKLSSLPISRKDLSSPALVYSGGFSRHRGLDTLIKAMSIVVGSKPDVHLYLVGGTARELEKSRFRNIVEELDLEKNITMTGWLSFEESINYVRSCDICIIPHTSMPHTETTIPHKLFQFMYLKKPILASNIKPLERIIKETESGMIFESGNENDIAEKILQMVDNLDDISLMGLNGHKAVIDKYNWEMDSRNLIKMYNNMEKVE